MTFEFATATRIVFGAGKLKELGSLIQGFGHRALVVTGRSAQRNQALSSILEAAGVASVSWATAGEPTVDSVRAGKAFAKGERCDFIISMGGGSVIDAGKAIAALMTNDGDPFDYLEVIGQGKPLSRPAAPFVAIPTTAGAGAEVTRNAVLGSPEHRVKVSLRSPFLLPKLALVDPELTYDLPPVLTASTGLDALTQLIEPFVSMRANPITDSFCHEGILRIARALRRTFENGRDIADREDMALASLLGGLALANAGLGVVHGFAAPIGGMFPAPHGAVCAALLPHAMEVNLRALRDRAPNDRALPRFDEIARLLTGRHDATADAGSRWLRDLCSELQVPPLRTYGIAPKEFPEITEKAAQASSMKTNPITLRCDELNEIMERAT